MAEIIDLVELRRLADALEETKYHVRGANDRLMALDARFNFLERRSAEADVARSRDHELWQRIERRLDVGFADANARLDRLEERQAGVEARMDRLEARMDRLEARMDRLEARMGRLEADMAEVKATLAEVLALLRERR